MLHHFLYTQPASIWHHIFGRHAPLDVEIGFGHGDFLIQRACTYPQRNLVGIEYKTHLVRKAMKRKAKKGLHNLHILQGNAHNLVPTAFAAGEIHNIFLNFPDPWWKKTPYKTPHSHNLFCQATC